ncbi:MAG: DNA polymerase I, partial [Bacteroidales bacterium]|nr:DNA polymerase I [Bacteroidales bacterium]
VLLCDKVMDNLMQIGLAGLYDEMEEPLSRVLADMECEGVKVDLDQLRQIASGMKEQLDEIQQRIREMAGEPELNVMSTKQIGAVIFEKLALDPKVKKASEGKRYSYSTDEETLTALADRHPIINEILEYRGIRKLLSTYLEPLGNYISPRTGKIHTTFNQALTATGRLSSSKPNLQNIPVRTERGREIRRAFVPSHPDGVILSADYSQIELRVMAHLSGDEHMVRAFRENKDIHTITASRLFGVDLQDVTPEQRRKAKTANFGMIYGISAFGLSQRLKVSRKEAKEIIDGYFENFSAVRAYIDGAIEKARERGYVETIFGRRRYLPDINAKNATVRALAERNAVNAPVQGSAADIIKKAMINVADRISREGLRSRMILQVHDELVFDARPDEAETLKKIVREEMENVIELTVPLAVECNYGNNWLEAH